MVSVDARDFARSGYAAPLPVLDPHAAAELRAHYDLLSLQALDGVPLTRLKKPHLVDPRLASLVRDPRLLAPVVDILGPDVLCWSSLFFAKDGPSDAYVAWHQDATYWGLSSADVVTAWLAFTPSTRENGCLRVVPGSHLTDVRHRAGEGAANMLSRNQEIEAHVDEEDAVDIVLAPGEMSIHHVKIVHGSEPNRSDRPRIGYAIRYVAGHVRQASAERDSATLVAGRDHGHFDAEPAPAGLLDPAAITYHGQMMLQQAAIQNSIG